MRQISRLGTSLEIIEIMLKASVHGTEALSPIFSEGRCSFVVNL